MTNRAHALSHFLRGCACRWDGNPQPWQVEVSRCGSPAGRCRAPAPARMLPDSRRLAAARESCTVTFMINITLSSRPPLAFSTERVARGALRSALR